MAHRFSIRVYYSDTDAGGIVYHGRYLDFAEHARTEMLREAARSSQRDLMHERHIAYVVKSISVDYHLPALLDDLLDVVTEVEQAKRFSITFLQHIFRDSVELATVHVRVGALDLRDRKIVQIDPWFIESPQAEQ